MQPTILIVDDEQDFVGLLTFRLARLACELLVANDGIHALTLARERQPDLILLDILLPDMDGLSICEILRRQPATRNTPVVFMSALSSEVTQRTARMMAAEDYFVKPIDLSRFEERIAELLHLEHG